MPWCQVDTSPYREDPEIRNGMSAIPSFRIPCAFWLESCFCYDG